jgi:hypothetical protein
MKHNIYDNLSSSNFTVGIPTFNRHERFLKLYNQLYQYSGIDNFKLIISDNNSGPKVNSIIEESEFKNNINFINRKFNVGPIANILRIFEECQTEWLIIIGDDDEINPSFFSDLRQEIAKNSNNDSLDVMAIKFRSNVYPGQKNTIIESLEQFCEYNQNLRQFGSTLLISTWLFRVDAVTKYLRYGYLFSGMQMPHVVPLLKGLQGGGKIRYSSRSPINFKEADDDSRWDGGLTFIMAFFNLYLYPDFKNLKQIHSISKIFGGDNFKSTLGFILRIYYSYNGGSFWKLLIWYMTLGLNKFICGLSFLALIPFLGIKRIKRNLLLRLGITNDERM